MTEYLIYSCLACSVGIFAWVLVDLYSRFDFSPLSQVDGIEREDAPFLVRSLLPFARAAGSGLFELFGENSKFLNAYRRRTERMILMAGEPAGIETVDCAGFVIVGALLGALTGAVTFYMVKSWGGAFILSGIVLGAMLPHIWMTDRIKARQMQIRKGLPYCLDLVTLAVEAGMDFTTALQIVGGKMSLPALKMELKRTLRAIQMGRIRSEALRDLARRVNISELSSVTSAIIQADELGANLGPILRIQSEQLRRRRFQLAEKLAMEAPVKILMPLIAFLFPVTLIVVFGPLVAAYLSRSLL